MRKRNNLLMWWRAYVVLMLVFIFGGVILVRLVFLQIMNAGFYKALSQGQQSLNSLAKGERGNIFVEDKNGVRYVLAANQKSPFAYVSPVEVENRDETATKLAEILELDRDTVAENIADGESQFAQLKKRISPREAKLLYDAAIPGVYVGQENIRVYPQASLASHLVGFTNSDDSGQYGVEEKYDDMLVGEEGLRQTSSNPASYLSAALAESIPDGSDIVLTIDYNVQAFAESLLARALTSLNIVGGSIIVMNPLNGEILALANEPVFNPNEYSKVEDFETFQNPTIQKIFEPGSIFKPLTMAAAIDAGKVTPETRYVDAGIIRIGGRKVYNYDQRVWGEQSMTDVLGFSINTGAVFAEQRLGHENFVTYIKKFGLFEPTEIDLAGEIYSRNAEFQKGYEINYATASFGQGIEMTPMQVVRAFSSLANNGILANPHVVRKIEDQEINKAFTGKGEHSVVTPKTSAQISTMLVNVVENGYAKSAKIPGYYIAGKTGTAQISWSALGVQKSGYSDKTIQSFIGYAPAYNPQFLILVKLDDPRTRTAEYSAVPIFRDLAKYIIDYYQIPPDYEIE